MEFMHPAPGVAADIGRIVPGAVVHHCPAHELCARIVRIAVVIEEVGHGETARRDGVALDRTLTGKLVLIAIDGLFLIAESRNRE